MSQQGPGGYGGGGPYGPPGGGGPAGGGGYGGPPPGGYPPAPPGGYGPPGGQSPGGYGGPPGAQPPGGYGPPGYGQPQYGAPPPGGQPPPSKSPLIWVGIGCGVLVLLGAIGGVVSFILARRAADNVEKQIDIAATSVAAGASALSAVTGNAASTPACASAIACCKLTVAKTAGANAPAIEQACSGLAMLSDAQCTAQLDAYKRAALALGFTCP